ncbi:MAG: ABC transporter transmembrane domain-containing protein [Pseudomonadota bacterium]|nr:ABC transporter transmembrane domain-containing protein [Pseudomonadota bacterium]
MFRLTTTSPLWRLSHFFTPYLNTLALALLALILSTGFYLSVPIAIRYVFDVGLQSSLMQSFWIFFLCLLVCLGFSITSAWRFYLVSWLGERIVADLRVAVFRKVLSYEMQVFEFIQTGEILSRLTTDTVLIEQIIGTSLSMALRNSIALLGALLMIFLTSWQLALLVLCVTPCVLLPIILVLRWQRRLSRDSQDALALTSAYAGEVLQAILVTKAFCHQDYDHRRYQNVIEQSFDSAKKRIWMRALLTVVVIFFILSGLLTVLWFGFSLLRTTPPILSAGELAQFLSYALIVAVSFAAVSEVWGDIQRAAGASERLIELLEKPGEFNKDESSSDIFPEQTSLDITIRHLSFSYPSRSNVSVIDNLNLTIESGKMTAFVGHSGAGKTTLLHLLLRLYTIERGDIYFGKYSIATLPIGTVRALMSFVPQDVSIFSGSILENIHYGQPKASLDSVYAAAKSALVDDFVQNLPAGYATQVGERGMRLSGGQKQRIAIARAFLRNAPFLLLDEATSALDPKNEALLQSVLSTLMKKRTTLVVAHRLSTVRKADKIVFMEKGRLIAEGTHNELMQDSPAYAQFVHYQLSD